jgi:hypothetical protein
MAFYCKNDFLINLLKKRFHFGKDLVIIGSVDKREPAKLKSAIDGTGNKYKKDNGN